MKKVLLILICFLSVLAIAQEIDKPYDFPVKPGTDQWAKLSSSKEMDSVCVIPDEILKDISTKALFITCLNYPRIIDVFSGDNLQTGFDFISVHFNGLAELLKRPDLDQILVKSYPDIDIQLKNTNRFDPKLLSLQIGFFEILLAQEKIINGLGEEEKIKLLSEAIVKLEKRISKGESLYRQMTSALILSRILVSKNIRLTGIDKYGNDFFSVFNSYAIITDTTVIDKILVASKETVLK